MSSKQIGGEHYSVAGTRRQHWDVVREFGLGYMEGNITKYIFRWKSKGGIEDLRKARSYLDKLIEQAMEEEI